MKTYLLVVCVAFTFSLIFPSKISASVEGKPKKGKEVKVTENDPERLKIPGVFLGVITTNNAYAIMCRGEEGKCAVVLNSGAIKIFPDGVETSLCNCNYLGHTTGDGGYFDSQTNEWVEEYIITVTP